MGEHGVEVDEVKNYQQPRVSASHRGGRRKDLSKRQLKRLNKRLSKAGGEQAAALGQAASLRQTASLRQAGPLEHADIPAVPVEQAGEVKEQLGIQPAIQLEHHAEPLSAKPPKKRRSLPGCLAVIVAAGLLAGGGYVVVTKGVEVISKRLAAPEDYSGTGSGQATIEVREGDTGADIGNTLKGKGVVKSVEAFIDAYAANPRSTSIQVGFYQLSKKMKASAAVKSMIDPKNLIEDSITVPEGLRLVEVVDLLADKTDFSKAQFNKVLAKPGKIGLPAYAKGNAEGYLFPATYALAPAATPESVLRNMVERWKQAADQAGLAAAAARLGYTEAELMTIASLVEAEGRGEDMPKIARVIYNRLEKPDNGITNGLLQIDATVNYAIGRNLGVALTQAELDVDSPYNTRKYPGLPPGPIEAPGDDAIAAAAKPADGNWLFYVTVNLKTGETKFTSSYDQFLKFADELDKYCTTSDSC
jgi:UPF0755 protein